MVLKENLKLEPSELQRVTTLIMLPWSFKLLLGMTADNLPIFGSRRKSYLILMSLLMILTMAQMGYSGMQSYNEAIILLFTFSTCLAFTDLLREAIMVGQARTDPQTGAAELQSYCYTWLSIGGLFGSTLAAFLTDGDDLSSCYYVCASLGLILLIATLNMSHSVEEAEG